VKIMSVFFSCGYWHVLAFSWCDACGATIGILGSIYISIYLSLKPFIEALKVIVFYSESMSQLPFFETSMDRPQTLVTPSRFRLSANDGLSTWV